jgi:hypothetical protein
VAAQRSSRAISYLQLAAAAFLLAVIAFGAINLLWEQEYAEPRVSVLGSGDRLSALITSGHARVLLATGNDPAAAANALGRVRHPTLPRLDVLIAAGEGIELAVPASLAGNPDTRLDLAISPIEGEYAAQLGGARTVSSPRVLDLPDGMTVTLENATVSSATGGAAWRVTVQRGNSRVILLSNGDDAGLFPPAGTPNVLVVAGANPLDGWGEYPAPLLAFGDAALAPDDLRDSVDTDADGPDWAVRVFPGEAVSFRFTSGAVEADPSAAVRLVPDLTPSGGTGSP